MQAGLLPRWPCRTCTAQGDPGASAEQGGVPTLPPDSNTHKLPSPSLTPVCLHAWQEIEERKAEVAENKRAKREARAARINGDAAGLPTALQTGPLPIAVAIPMPSVCSPHAMPPLPHQDPMSVPAGLESS